MAYTKPQQRKKEESERLEGERDQIEFIDLRFKDLHRNHSKRSPIDLLS